MLNEFDRLGETLEFKMNVVDAIRHVCLFLFW